MAERKYSNSLIILLWVISGILWCYIFYRAVALPITHDEGYSYYLVKTNYWRAMPGTANNHWLTTLSMRIFLWFPGNDDPWKLRMLSVLCWPLFAFCVIQIVKNFFNKWLGIAFYAAAMFNPYLIFYFSLGRGYAPGCAFAMVCIWLAEKAIRKHPFAPAVWVPAFFAGSLAVLANFTCFYFYIAFTGAYLFHLLWNRQLQQLFKREAIRWWIVVGGTFIFAVAQLVFINIKEGFSAGSEGEMINSIFGSLLAKSIQVDFQISNYQPLAIMVFTILLVGVVISCFHYFKTRKLTVAFLMLLTAGGIVLLNLVLHVMFNTLFMLERTALIIYVPLVYGLIKLPDGLAIVQRAKALRMAVIFVACLLVAGYSWNLYKSYSPRYFREFTEETETQEALDTLVSFGARRVGLSAWQYGIHRNYYSMAFPKQYTFQFGFYWRDGSVVIPDGGSVTERFDYLLMDNYYRETWNWEKDWEVVKRYEISGLMVLKKKG